jgi:hypothetical protein
MKNKSLRYLAIAVAASSMTALMSLELAVTAPAAEAACRPSGRYAGGLPILNCSGRTSCRPTGRYKRVNGRKLQILSCPRR